MSVHLDTLNISHVTIDDNIEELEVERDGGVKMKKRHRRGKKLRKAKPYAAEIEISTTVSLAGSDAQKSVAGGVSNQTDFTNSEAAVRPLQRGGGLRPRYSPQAPRNYTQYIIDDQLGCGDAKGALPRDNLEFASFVVSQFEVELKQHRADELAAKSQDELRSLVHQLENRLSSLESHVQTCTSCKEELLSSTDCSTTSSHNSDTVEEMDEEDKNIDSAAYSTRLNRKSDSSDYCESLRSSNVI